MLHKMSGRTNQKQQLLDQKLNSNSYQTTILFHSKTQWLDTNYMHIQWHQDEEMLKIPILEYEMQQFNGFGNEFSGVV